MPRFAGLPVDAAPQGNVAATPRKPRFAGTPVQADSYPPTPAPQAAPQTTNIVQATNYALDGANSGIGNFLSAPNQLLRAIMSIGPTTYNAIGHPGSETPAAGPDWVDALPDAGKSYDRLVEAIREGAGGAKLPPPTTLVDKLAHSTGEAMGAAALPAVGEASVAAQPLRTLASELFTAGSAGLGGGVAAAATNDNPAAELVGEVLGGGAGLLAKGGIKKAITPYPTSPERLQAADTMAQNGVDLTAGQKTGSKSLKYAESELGGVDAADLAEKQGGQFTRAVLQKAGINADRATPEVMDQAFTRIGADFDGLAAQTSVPLDQQLQNDMLQVAADYQSVAGAPAPAVEQMVNRAGELAAQNGGVLAGQAYQNLRSKIGELSRKADGPTKGALLDLQDALDDAVQRNMPPPLLPQWQEARRQYKNMLVIEKAASAGGENAALGILSPAQIRMADTGQNRRAYVRGKSDFSELAHAGSATMTPLPQSGTAPRTAVRNLGTSLPTVLGSGIGGAAGGVPGALVGAAAGAAIPHVTGKAIMSDLGQRYLANQALKPSVATDPRLIAAIVASAANSRPTDSGAQQEAILKAIQRQ